MTNIFENRRKSPSGKNQVPVWFMRQAGRYHSHYQQRRSKNGFMQLCKNADLACEVTLGPIEDFGFNAAIMFSDLLFPLEQFNLGLSYEQGPPTLEKHLINHDAYKDFSPLEESSTFYQFQAQTLINLKEALAPDVTLLGFVGAPFTLYTYATEGGHKGNLILSKQGLYDGRFNLFCEKLIPSLIENINLQLKSGADAICLFDTAVGELCLKDYKQFIIPVLKMITKEVKSNFPNKKIIYYSKMTNVNYLRALESDEIDVIGIDWRMDLPLTLKEFSKDYYIQGNIDPAWLHLPNKDLMNNLEILKESLKESDLSRWIAGLGHGVLVKTPEENVRSAVKFFQSIEY